MCLASSIALSILEAILAVGALFGPHILVDVQHAHVVLVLHVIRAHPPAASNRLLAAGLLGLGATDVDDHGAYITDLDGHGQVIFPRVFAWNVANI